MHTYSEQPIDIRSLSLSLYHKRIAIKFKEESKSFKQYGVEIKGQLIGRSWKQFWEKGQNKETLVGLTIRIKDQEILIPTNDILAMSESVL